MPGQISHVNVLEQQLLSLGQSEFALEQLIRDLLARTRKAGSEGNEEAAENAWALHQEAKATLAALRNEISAVEIRLYALRRQMRK